MDHPFINPTVLSYCPGILGLERGLKRAIGSIRTVAYVEIEAFIVENLLVGMEAGLLDAAPIWANLKTFDAKPFRGMVDIITGGYPCQPFSAAGARRGAKDPRHLWPYLARDIKAIKPLCCFFENVSGHLTLGFNEVYRSLSNMGYAVEAGLFTAEEVGATHERERLFILAIRRDFLAHTNNVSSSAGTERTGRQKRSDPDRRSERSALADPDIHAAGRQPRTLQSPSCTAEGTPQRQNGKRRRNVAGNFSEGMAHSTCTGLAELRNDGKQDEAHNNRIGDAGTEDRWPAPPGEEQFDWEEPRIVSRLGFSIDGYNYREDLLRALGNAVVEQVAELAFKNLLAKHMPNLEFG